MKKQNLTPAVPLGVSMIFALTGILRIVKGGLGWSDFTGSVNEYSFHIFAGMFFGWTLLVAVAGLFRRELKKRRSYEYPATPINLKAPVQ